MRADATGGGLALQPAEISSRRAPSKETAREDDSLGRLEFDVEELDSSFLPWRALARDLFSDRFSGAHRVHVVPHVAIGKIIRQTVMQEDPRRGLGW